MSNYTNADYAAYPSNYDDNVAPEYGLTKREYLAAMAMQGLLTCFMDNDCSIKEICEDAVSAADDLIKQLESKNDR